jgi:hypothetical protein
MTEIEPNNSTPQATAVTYNTAMAGSTGACAPTDNSVDYFTFTPPDQGVLRLQFSASNSGGTSLDITAYLRNSNGSVLQTLTIPAGANNVAVNTAFTHTCSGIGTYYISIENPSGSVCTNYSFTYDMLLPVYANDSEPNQSTAQATDTLAAGADQDGRVEFDYGNNFDYFRILAPNDGVMTVNVSAENAGTTGTMTVYLRNSNGSVFETWTANVGANGIPADTSFTHHCTGTELVYYLEFDDPSVCGTSYRFSYTVATPLFADDSEPNQSTPQALVANHSTNYDGRVEFEYDNNYDYFQLQAPNDGVMTVNVLAEHAGSNSGTLTIYLRNNNGSVLETWTANVGANGIPADTSFTHHCTGTELVYYLEFDDPSVCGTSYRFSYTVATPVYGDDTEPNQSTTQALVANHSTNYDGRVEFEYDNNYDYFRLQAPNDGVMTVNVLAEHAGSTSGTLTIYLRNNNGSVLETWTANVGANGTPADTSFTHHCTGTELVYFLEFDDPSVCGTSYRFSYTVAAPFYADDTEPNQSTAQAVLIDLEDAPADGRLEFNYDNNNDYFKINHPGGPINVITRAESAGAAGTMTVYIRNSNGSVLVTNGSVLVGGNSTPAQDTTTLAAAAAGTYYIELNNPDVCGVSYRVLCNDTDNDGVCNNSDLCASTPNGEVANPDGCSCSQISWDDGDVCTLDECANGIVTHTFQDADGDAVCDADDLCAATPSGEGVNTDGCSCSQVIIDDSDACTLDACSNGVVSHTFQDADGDLTCDANDGCPNDVNKIAAGQCGCGVADTDTDGDLTADCNDGCPSDPNKIDPGVCGCGTADTDSDGDLTADCNDGCPNDPDKLAPGNCGCGNPEPGTTCDDGNSATINDVIGNDCQCAGTLLGNDCEGVPGGPAVPGTACNDNDACTTGDVYDINCQCTGTFADADNDGTCDADDLCPAGPEPGTTCDDGNSATINDVIGNDCQCAGTLLGNDCEGVPGGPAVPGTACNDNDACTTGDVYDINCQCTGTFADADNDGTCDADDLCPAGPEPGATCDDGNSATINDVIGNDCQCAGTLLGNDCEGVPGGPAVPGTACNDNDACTTGDVYDANCNCTGTFADADNDGTCDANDLCPAGPEPGTTCDDGNANTSNDMVDANCNCAGTPISGCPEETLVLSITLDDDGWQNIWILTKANGLPVAAGGPYASGMAGTVVTEQLCVPTGCYKLYVKDWGFNGIQNGGYELSDGNGHRIIDADGQFGFLSYMGGKFCLPVGEPELLPSSCDLQGFDGSTAVQCTPVAGASSYEFWFFDPHSNYERHFLRSQPALGPYPNANIPSGLDLNVRARALVGGNYTPYGPACRFSTADAPAMQLTGTDDLRMLSGELSAWPNPNNGDRLNISLTGLNANSATVDITLYDAMGRTVIATTVPAAGGAMNTVLDLTDTVDGVYLLRANANGQVKEQRILVVK